MKSLQVSLAQLAQLCWSISLSTDNWSVLNLRHGLNKVLLTLPVAEKPLKKVSGANQRLQVI